MGINNPLMQLSVLRLFFLIQPPSTTAISSVVTPGDRVMLNRRVRNDEKRKICRR
ncbi:hypothetical protein HanXRQr2_Chr16g0768971 [Helianthus annuus]|uniref:Uncharacterized protein n=1 Tax=Helianthus annuus TaxID=4232 RepID=A0A9K3GZQ4_HELAN|nr:hypothetical protein HanXRQr2_Chr16g0768971 [Helianthus annuus]